MKLPALVLASLLTMWAGISHASDTRFDAFMQRTVGNSTTVTFGTNGTPIATSSAPLGTPDVRGGGWTNTAQGVFFESNGSARLPDGRGTVPVTSKIKASAPVIGRALYRGAAALSLVGVGWQAGEELYDIWADLGLAASPSGPAMPSSTAQVSTGICMRIIASSNWNNEVGPWDCSFTSNTQANRQAVARQACSNNIGAAAVAKANAERGGGFQCNVVSTGFRIERASPASFYTSGNDSAVTSQNNICPAGQYNTGTSCLSTPPVEPLSEQDFLDEIATQSGWPSRTAQALARAANIAGVGDDIANDLEALPESETSVRFRTGTNSIQVGEPVVSEEVTTNPDGSTVTRTSTRTTTATTTGNQIRSSEETVTTTTTRDSAGTVIGVTNTVNNTTIEGDETAPAPAPADIEVCGLPTTPPCKIDETGTSEPLPDDGEATATGLLATLQTCADDLLACLPSVPDINWNFSLPSGCAPIALGGGFEQWIEPIDICEWQPMFHELMSLVWAAAGLFGAIAIVRPRSAA